MLLPLLLRVRQAPPGMAAARLLLHWLQPELLLPAGGDWRGVSHGQQVHQLQRPAAANAARRHCHWRVLLGRSRCFPGVIAVCCTMSQPAGAAWRAACDWAPSGRWQEPREQLRGMAS